MWVYLTKTFIMHDDLDKWLNALQQEQEQFSIEIEGYACTETGRLIVTVRHWTAKPE